MTKKKERKTSAPQSEGMSQSEVRGKARPIRATLRRRVEGHTRGNTLW
jgi:hypothetical protein